MTSDNQMYKDRLHIIKYFLENQLTVTEVCKLFNRSRTWFYKWFNRHKRYGPDGLWNIIRKPSAQPNQTTLDTEMAIIDFIDQYPSYGPKRISNELTRKGTQVRPSAVYNVLKRHHLCTKKLRLEYIRIKYNMVKTVSDLERSRDKAKTRHLKTNYPGHIIGMDVFYVGCLKGVGRIYQYTGIDTFASYGWTKLYTDKTAISACDFMMHVHNNSHDVPISSVLTDNGLEFTTHHKSKNHSFERLLKVLDIKHRLTKVRHPWTNGACERLNRTILEEFYQVTFRKRIYETIDQLNDELQKYLNTYNFQRTHQGKRTKGRVPGQLYLLHKKSA